jgi:hypothetical protein
MRRSQGLQLLPQEVDRIKFLLGYTDITLQDIAIRMDCSKSSIIAINRKFQIRQYRGRRSSWTCLFRSAA